MAYVLTNHPDFAARLRVLSRREDELRDKLIQLSMDHTTTVAVWDSHQRYLHQVRYQVRQLRGQL